MGKKARLKRERRQQAGGVETDLTEMITKRFQKELRHSELWHHMVAEFGEKKAAELLKECKVEMKPGDKI